MFHHSVLSLRRFEQKPYALFSLVDPDLDEARARDVTILLADVVCGTQRAKVCRTKDKRLARVLFKVEKGEDEYRVASAVNGIVRLTDPLGSVADATAATSLSPVLGRRQ